MTKENFIKLINEFNEFEAMIDKCEGTLGITIFESPLIETAHIWFDTIINETFTETGADLVNGYLFDHFNKQELVIYNNSETIIIDNPADLWDYVQEYVSNKS